MNRMYTAECRSRIKNIPCNNLNIPKIQRISNLYSKISALYRHLVIPKIYFAKSGIYFVRDTYIYIYILIAFVNDTYLLVTPTQNEHSNTLNISNLKQEPSSPSESKDY